MTSTPPQPGPAGEPWPERRNARSEIQDPVPAELQQGNPYGTAPDQLAPYQTLARVVPGATGVALTIHRGNTPISQMGVRIEVDNRLIPAEAGTTFVTLPPGRHTFTFSRTNTTEVRTQVVDVPAGQAVPLYYSMPTTVFQSAKLSTTPLQPQSMASTALVITALVVGIVAVCLVFVFGLGLVFWSAG
ncbi:hypothetical protein ACQBAU_00140 [Propionibacteriaceae bacterium Y2011]|uniref:hypothetical protein n=1 Tax=Microlunatus sp. Y2014 TaxID=3418488 RepID=UPI003B4FB4E8